MSGGEKKFSSSWHESSVVVKPTDPQLKLYQAVFVGGVRDYAAPEMGEKDWEAAAGRKQWAEDWIFDEESTEHDPGSFPWYCRRLNLNPSKTRERIKLVSELKKIIEAGVAVEESVVKFLKHGHVPQPEPKPKKQTIHEKMPIYDEDEDL